MFEYRAKTPATPLCRRCDSAVGEVTGRSQIPASGRFRELAGLRPGGSGHENASQTRNFVLIATAPAVCLHSPQKKDADTWRRLYYNEKTAKKQASRSFLPLIFSVSHVFQLLLLLFQQIADLFQKPRVRRFLSFQRRFFGSRFLLCEASLLGLLPFPLWRYPPRTSFWLLRASNPLYGISQRLFSLFPVRSSSYRSLLAKLLIALTMQKSTKAMSRKLMMALIKAPHRCKWNFRAKVRRSRHSRVLKR